MKLLWICNTIFPELAKEIGLEEPVFGGWLYDLANDVASSNNFTLAVASCYTGIDFRRIHLGNITFYLIPYRIHNRYPKELETYWKSICIEFCPEIIHIHGTEYPRALACMKVFSSAKYIISIQGMVGPYSRYFFAGIGFFDTIRCVTFRDLYRSDSLLERRIRWQKWSVFEKEYYQRANIVIGRTSWDRAHAEVYNKNLKYEFCNELLRSEFYVSTKWSIEKCQKRTIFLSQAGSPIKGLHKLLDAVYFLKQDYPNIQIRIAGPNIIANKSIKDRMRLSGYGKYILEKLKKYSLGSNIVFLGNLNAYSMIKEYLSANVFISPSSIENSPNSVCEAQMIGTPVIASYVGGCPDLITHRENGLLYRFEETEMLIKMIREIFTDEPLVNKISKNGICTAERRHRKNEILGHLIRIYENASDTKNNNC